MPFFVFLNMNESSINGKKAENGNEALSHKKS